MLCFVHFSVFGARYVIGPHKSLVFSFLVYQDCTKSYLSTYILSALFLLICPILFIIDLHKMILLTTAYNDHYINVAKILTLGF